MAKALDVPVYQLFYEKSGLLGNKKKPIRKPTTIKQQEMSADTRLFFGTLAKAFSKL